MTWPRRGAAAAALALACAGPGAAETRTPGDVVAQFGTRLVITRQDAQWRLAHGLALKAGYAMDAKDNSFPAGLTMGVGLRVGGREFSYAWTPFGGRSERHSISLVLRFGGG